MAWPRSVIGDLSSVSSAIGQVNRIVVIRIWTISCNAVQSNSSPPSHCCLCPTIKCKVVSLVMQDIQNSCIVVNVVCLLSVHYRLLHHPFMLPLSIVIIVVIYSLSSLSSIHLHHHCHPFHLCPLSSIINITYSIIHSCIQCSFLSLLSYFPHVACHPYISTIIVILSHLSIVINHHHLDIFAASVHCQQWIKILKQHVMVFLTQKHHACVTTSNNVMN